MNKNDILKIIVLKLEQTLEVLIQSANIAKEAATSEESKAENKYDTRGLEASYLAGAQAKRAAELKESIRALKKMDVGASASNTIVGIGSLIELEINGEELIYFFILPSQGGLKIDYQGKTIQTLTPWAPLGELLNGKKVGDCFELKINGRTNEYEIKELV